MVMAQKPLTQLCHISENIEYYTLHYYHYLSTLSAITNQNFKVRILSILQSGCWVYRSAKIHPHLIYRQNKYILLASE